MTNKCTYFHFVTSLLYLMIIVVLSNIFRWLMLINSLRTGGEFCRLLMTFANSLDPDQALIWIQAVWHSDVIPERKSWNKVMLKNVCRRQKIMKNYPACNEFFLIIIIMIYCWNNLTFWEWKKTLLPIIKHRAARNDNVHLPLTQTL